MKIVDTVVLIAYINPLDARCEKVTKHVTSLGEESDIFVPSASLVELDLELKTHNVSDEEREAIYSRLARLIPTENILPITPRTLKRAAELTPSGRGTDQDLKAAVSTVWQFHKDSGGVSPDININIEEAVDTRFLP